MRAVLVATLAHDVNEQHATLARIDHVFQAEPNRRRAPRLTLCLSTFATFCSRFRLPDLSSLSGATQRSFLDLAQVGCGTIGIL